MKQGPPEGSFAASTQAAADETRAQLRRSWQLREAVFDDCCDVQSELSKTSTRAAFAAIVRDVGEGLEGVQLEDVQEETSEVVIETDQDLEGASLRQHPNAAGLEGRSRVRR